MLHSVGGTAVFVLVCLIVAGYGAREVVHNRHRIRGKLPEDIQ